MRRMYDSVTAANIPADAELVAGYIDGMYAWSEADWARWAHVPQVRIAVFASTNDGNCLDVEQGCSAPEDAPGWVHRRREAGADPTVYCSESPWATVRAAFAAQGEPEPHWWVANYNKELTIPEGAVAHQYWDFGPYDSSVAADYWPGVDDMTPEQAAQLQAVYEFIVGRGNPKGADELAKWNANGNSLVEGYALLQQALAAAPTTVPDHKHTISWKDQTEGVIRA